MARIIVKFRGDLADIAYQDGAQFTLPAPALAGWEGLAVQFPDAALSLDRLLTTQTEAQIQSLLHTAQLQSGEDPPDYSALWRSTSTVSSTRRYSLTRSGSCR